MQELMSRHKMTTFSPRDCLRTILHQRWSKTCSGKFHNHVLRSINNNQKSEIFFMKNIKLKRKEIIIF